MDAAIRAVGERLLSGLLRPATFVPEAKEQPGLLRFISHRTVPEPPIVTTWHRLSEMWYEDFAAWQKAVVEPGIRETAGTTPCAMASSSAWGIPSQSDGITKTSAS